MNRTTTMDRIPWSAWRIALVVAFGAFMSGLDTSIVNIGLDTIARVLHGSLDEVQWVSSGYLIALAVSLPICGWLGRRAEVGRLWLIALAAFTVTSGLCALAPDVPLLIGLRVVQGLAGGLLIPAGQTVLGQAVGPTRLGRVMGIAVALAPAIGPSIGGFLLNSLSWQWLFLVNVPIGLIALALGLRIVPRGRPGTVPPLDWAGFALVGLGLPLVVYAVTMWGETGTVTPARVWIPFVIGVPALLLFGLRSLRRRHPLLDLRLFRDPVYAAANGASTFGGAGMFGAMLLFPLYFEILHGENVGAAGLSLFALGFGTAVALPVSGRFTDRYGGGIVAIAGNLLTVLATLPFTLLSATANPVLVQVLLFVRGVATALSVMPAGTAAYASVHRDQLPDATTQVNITQRIGGAIGAALVAVVLARNLGHGRESAFHLAFGWLTGASVIALAAAVLLWLAIRANGRTPSHVDDVRPGTVSAREPA